MGLMGYGRDAFADEMAERAAKIKQKDDGIKRISAVDWDARRDAEDKSSAKALLVRIYLVIDEAKALPILIDGVETKTISQEVRALVNEDLFEQGWVAVFVGPPDGIRIEKK